MSQGQQCSAPVGEPIEGSYFVSTYPPFSCWTEAGSKGFLRKLSRPRETESAPLGLYLHIPFCVERCQYCYYLAYDNRSQEVDRYLSALVRELDLYAAMPGVSGRAPEFVYIGGGTPSVLSVSRLGRLLEQIRRVAPLDRVREFSFECAPKTVTTEKLRILKEAGVTRLSLGVQQLDDRVLVQSGRIHLVEDVERAWRAIGRVGFEQVNLDLIVGLVGETDKTFHDGLERVIQLAPDSVTIYQLEIPLNTPLYRAMSDDRLPSPPASWETKRNRLRQGLARLEGAGYALRSAYTAVRDPERHGFVYQDEQYRGADLLGLGASSFSHFSGVNHQNRASLGAYVAALEAGELPLWRGYEMTDEERLIREFVLQLKLGAVRRDYFRAKFDIDVRRRFAEPLDRFATEGLIELTDESVELTREGLLRVDRMLPAFYLERHRGLRYS